MKRPYLLVTAVSLLNCEFLVAHVDNLLRFDMKVEQKNCVVKVWIACDFR